MPASFFFYDLETSGLNPRDDRVMQFAGIRTDESFQMIGEPYNFLVTLSDDTLPSPCALMITGVSPQQTVQDGYSEADFARLFVEEICTPDTTLLGFNSIRFDDEFMRSMLWRNFHDPYEWSWRDGRSRWDMLDVVRMTRALRPDGIKWPVVDGKPSNRLELLSAENGLEHTKAHDALSDVEALISVTKLIATAQPDLFKYLYKIRDKNEVKKLVSLTDAQPFVYTSGRYDVAYEMTTIAYPVAEADFGNVFVYDLRHDPSDWVAMSEAQLREIIDTPYGERSDDFRPLPIKKLQYNRTPAVAPLGVLAREDGWGRLQLDQKIIEKYVSILRAHPHFGDTVARLLLRKPDYPSLPDAESRLYDGFVNDQDKLRCETVRNASPDELRKMAPKFTDERLNEMFVPYKARNFPRTLTDSERASYESLRNARLSRQAPKFIKELHEVAARDNVSEHQRYIIDELKLWYEAIMPELE